MTHRQHLEDEIKRLSNLEIIDCGCPVPSPGATAQELSLRILDAAAAKNMLPYSIVPSVSSSITLWYYDGTVHAEVESKRDGTVLLVIDRYLEGDEPEVLDYYKLTVRDIQEIVDKLADALDPENIFTDSSLQHCEVMA